jgi:hypothetical protein
MRLSFQQVSGVTTGNSEARERVPDSRSRTEKEAYDFTPEPFVTLQNPN